MKAETTLDIQEPFDCQAVYDAQITPLMQQLYDLCTEHKIPLLLNIVYQSNSKSYGAGLVCVFIPERTPLKMYLARGMLDPD